MYKNSKFLPQKELLVTDQHAKDLQVESRVPDKENLPINGC